MRKGEIKAIKKSGKWLTKEKWLISFLKKQNVKIKKDNILNKKSGLLGISGISNDMRNLLQAKDKGDKKAELAIDIFCYHLKKYIGSYMAVLGRTDAVIFTAGIGENVPYVREKSLSGMEELGIEIDEKKNKQAKHVEAEISGEGSKVKVWVIPTNEEIRMAFDAYEIAMEKK